MAGALWLTAAVVAWGAGAAVSLGVSLHAIAAVIRAPAAMAVTNPLVSKRVNISMICPFDLMRFCIDISRGFVSRASIKGGQSCAPTRRAETTAQPAKPLAEA